MLYSYIMLHIITAIYTVLDILFTFICTLVHVCRLIERSKGFVLLDFAEGEFHYLHILVKF